MAGRGLCVCGRSWVLCLQQVVGFTPVAGHGFYVCVSLKALYL